MLAPPPSWGDHRSTCMAIPKSPADSVQDVLRDPEIQRLIDSPEHQGLELSPSRQIYTNRALQMDQSGVVGFDMDYTLAVYSMRQIEGLAFHMTLERLVAGRGYRDELRNLKYDHEYVIRGLVVDKDYGNIFKMDRHNHVGRCYHGRRQLSLDERRALYQTNEKIRLSLPRFAWIDTLFSLPEACLYAEIIEAQEARGEKVDYHKLYDDTRESIDEVHRDGSLKSELRKDLGRFIKPDPELPSALHKLRSGGKKLFVLTNSLWDYTDAVMRFLLDGRLPEYPSWRNYFDYIVVGAQKPSFFAEHRPFVELSADGAIARAQADALERGGPVPADLEARRLREKQDLERLRRAFKATLAEGSEVESRFETGANAYWGLVFKEGNENSRFGEQVEDYADLYTSRVSNFLYYSPMQVFRSPRATMPHERTTLRRG